jgi:hypothetical protein
MDVMTRTLGLVTPTPKTIGQDLVQATQQVTAPQM